MTTLKQQDLDALAEFDTPTICNALELVAPDRRALGFNRRPLVAPFPSMKPAVGYARTATIRGCCCTGTSIRTGARSSGRASWERPA